AASAGGAPQVTVAYLSPLVLRKELESLLENEGEAVLARPQFLDNHSIVFWNLLWYFQRLRLPSNLLQLVQVSPLLARFPQSALRVRLLWDTLTPDLEQWPPLYVLWRIHSKSPERAEAPERLRHVSLSPPGGVPMRSYSWRRHNHPFTLAFLEEVLRWVGMNEVHKAVTLFLDTLDRQPGSPRTQRWADFRRRRRGWPADAGVCVFGRSLYRELLFLTLAAMGQDHVGTPPLTSDPPARRASAPAHCSSLPAAAFDKKYKAAYSRWAPRWAGRSCGGSGRSSRAPRPSTAGAASTRHCSAEAPPSSGPQVSGGPGGSAQLKGRAEPEGDLSRVGSALAASRTASF
ncbi:unnamed protein product, partial [Tetraodon nigroviridis]